MSFFVDIALNLPLNQTFSYKCELEGEDMERSFGRRVQVPFGENLVAETPLVIPQSTAQRTALL